VINRAVFYAHDLIPCANGAGCFAAGETLKNRYKLALGLSKQQAPKYCGATSQYYTSQKLILFPAGAAG
jgi:hypothetical protein